MGLIKAYIKGENWDQYSKQELGASRLANIVIICVFVYLLNRTTLTIWIIMLIIGILHYLYREILLEIYIFKNFKK